MPELREEARAGRHARISRMRAAASSPPLATGAPSMRDNYFDNVR